MNSWDYPLVYYSANTEYDFAVSKYPFHDSGIADEGLSDEEESNNQENQLGKNDTNLRVFWNVFVFRR